MQERQEKSSSNSAKPLVKKEGGSAVKSNGLVVKKEVDSQGRRKELLAKTSTNGVKSLVKKEALTSTKHNGTYVKRELDVSPEKKLVVREASSSGGKTVVTKSITKTKITSVKTEEKKGKKVFTLPGQKHEAPEERDPLRIFYESLHDQIPESEMAEIWMMEHGLLDAGHAKKALERKQKRQQNERNGTPIKSATPSRDLNIRVGNKSSSSNGKSSKVIEQKGKRKRDYSDSDDDFIGKPTKRKLKS